MIYKTESLKFQKTFKCDQIFHDQAFLVSAQENPVFVVFINFYHIGEELMFVVGIREHFLLFQ